MKNGANTEETAGIAEVEAIKRVTITLPAAVHAQATSAAEKEERSLSNYLTRVIRNAVDDPKKEAVAS